MSAGPGSESRGALRVAWVVGAQLEGRLPARERVLASGGTGLVRYRWVADEVNRRPELGLRYFLYRPWRGHDALLFLKSMGPRSLALLQRAQRRGRLTVFDANVNYYERSGTEHYAGMLPSRQQTEDAVAMTRAADAVIADSPFLEQAAARHARRVAWIPDSVRMDLVPPQRSWRLKDGALRLLWCGESLKLFELLAIADVLRRHAGRIELVLVTNDLVALERWAPGHRAGFEALLRDVPHRIVPYRSVEHLFEVYSHGGVVISPRHLDNSYNLGHTEWKITLGMACGRMILCSPVPSYVKVAERSGGRGIRVCEDAEQWDRALGSLLSAQTDLAGEERAAREVVERFYATSVVAEAHARLLRSLFDEGGPTAGPAQ